MTGIASLCARLLSERFERFSDPRANARVQGGTRSIALVPASTPLIRWRLTVRSQSLGVAFRNLRAPKFAERTQLARVLLAEGSEC